MNTENNYCSQCGSYMIKVKFTSGYDTETGKPKQYYEIKCPKYDYSSIFNDKSLYHDAQTYTEDGWIVFI